MHKKEDKNTRYFIDLDLRQQRILDWDFGDKNSLSQELPNPDLQRVFISRGQYNKLSSRSSELHQSKKCTKGTVLNTPVYRKTNATARNA